MPIFGERERMLAAEAGRMMESAGQRLNEAQPGPSLPFGRRAIESIAALESGIEKMLQTGKGGRGGRKKGGRGMARRMPMPFSPQGEDGAGEGDEGGERDWDGRGGRGVATEKVEIPDPSLHRVPKEIREDVMKAMQGGAPAAYRSSVRRYYERIAK